MSIFSPYQESFIPREFAHLVGGTSNAGLVGAAQPGGLYLYSQQMLNSQGEYNNSLAKYQLPSKESLLIKELYELYPKLKNRKISKETKDLLKKKKVAEDELALTERLVLKKAEEFQKLLTKCEVLKKRIVSREMALAKLKKRRSIWWLK